MDIARGLLSGGVRPQSTRGARPVSATPSLATSLWSRAPSSMAHDRERDRPPTAASASRPLSFVPGHAVRPSDVSGTVTMVASSAASGGSGSSSGGDTISASPKELQAVPGTGVGEDWGSGVMRDMEVAGEVAIK
ncbi:hypothetical protein HDU93_006759, partial [Gonapodya sp. JEL0774]